MSDQPNGQELESQNVIQQGEGTQPDELSTSNKPVEELPEDASERTREQFEKLKAKNREMAEKLKQFEGKKSTLDIFNTPQPTLRETQQPVFNFNTQKNKVEAGQLSQAQVDKIAKDLIDEDGYIDRSELERRLSIANEAENRAKEAENQARLAIQRVTHIEQTQQARELHAQFPELDPESDSFNEEFFDLVKKDLLDQLVRTGTQDAISSAKKYGKYFKQAPTNQPIESGVTGVNRQIPQQSVKRGVVRTRDDIYARIKAGGY